MVSLLILLAIIFWKKRKLALILIITAVTVLWIGGNRWVSRSLVKSLEYRYKPPEQLSAADAIIILGGGTEPMEPPRTSAEINGAGDRVVAGFRLYNERIAPMLILSGGDIDFLDSSSASPAGDMRELLLLFGVPGEAMILDETSRNTYENAVNCAEIIREKGYQSVILVTSASHMHRSVLMFEKQGVSVIPFPVDYSVTNESWHQLWHGSFESVLINIFPTASSLSATTNVMKEYLGILYYSGK